MNPRAWRTLHGGEEGGRACAGIAGAKPRCLTTGTMRNQHSISPLRAATGRASRGPPLALKLPLRLLARLLGEPHYAARELSTGSLQ